MSVFAQLASRKDCPRADTAGPVVIMTRIRLARNLRDCFFPDRADAQMRAHIRERCEKALGSLPAFKGGLVFDIERLNEWDKDVLVESHLISRELAQAKPGASVFISKDCNACVMVNEEDHLRMQFLRAGLQFKQAYKNAEQLDKALEKKLDFAFSDELGYLTACPTNVGTGLRGSALMHLPGLVLSGQMEKVVRAVSLLGMTVRGLSGEGSEAHGSMFQISNQQTLGEKETQILQHIEAVLGTIVEQEENARLRLIEDSPEKLFDKIGRCYGTLRHAHVLTSSEALNFLSLIRLAADLNILPPEKRPALDELIVQVQPGHLRGIVGSQSMPPAQRDIARAAFLRERMKAFPEPDFSKAGL